MDLHLSIVDRFVSCKFYDKRDYLDLEIVNFPFLDGDVPRAASYSVYISQLIRFARVSNNVSDFKTRNKLLTAKLLNQGYRYHKLRKVFSKFYRRHSDLVSKKGKRKVQGVPQSQTAALPRPQEEEETDKSKQAQTEQTYEKH